MNASNIICKPLDRGEPNLIIHASGVANQQTGGKAAAARPKQQQHTRQFFKQKLEKKELDCGNAFVRVQVQNEACSRKLKAGLSFKAGKQNFSAGQILQKGP